MPDTLERIQAAIGLNYRLDRAIGRGGMATVYLAEDLKHHRRVAIKVLKPELAEALGSDRFLQEIEIAAGLTHPHILPLHDSCDVEGRLHYVMPFVDGESLRGLLNRSRTLERERALHLTEEVASALTYAHRQGVVHRDIKPENILLAEGHAVVADFGIAKAISTAGGIHLTRTGFPIGTPGYMSPEQAVGRTDLDETTDVYSLACVFYEMVVGETPEMWPTDEATRLGRFVDASPGIGRNSTGCRDLRSRYW
jgi:serine/threonine-protein kinase